MVEKKDDGLRQGLLKVLDCFERLAELATDKDAQSRRAGCAADIVLWAGERCESSDHKNEFEGDLRTYGLTASKLVYGWLKNGFPHAACLPQLREAATPTLDDEVFKLVFGKVKRKNKAETGHKVTEEALSYSTPTLAALLATTGLQSQNPEDLKIEKQHLLLKMPEYTMMEELFKAVPDCMAKAIRTCWSDVLRKPGKPGPETMEAWYDLTRAVRILAPCIHIPDDMAHEIETFPRPEDAYWVVFKRHQARDRLLSDIMVRAYFDLRADRRKEFVGDLLNLVSVKMGRAHEAAETQSVEPLELPPTGLWGTLPVAMRMRYSRLRDRLIVAKDNIRSGIYNSEFNKRVWDSVCRPVEYLTIYHKPDTGASEGPAETESKAKAKEMASKKPKPDPKTGGKPTSHKPGSKGSRR